VTFTDLLYILFLALFSIPLDMLGGLALPILGSSDLRDLINFYTFFL
jgi:hypothetical protein